MKKVLSAALAVMLACWLVTVAFAQNSGNVAAGAFAIGKGPNVTGYTSLLCGAGQLAVGQAGAPICRTISGDATLSSAGAVTLASIIAPAGPVGTATAAPVITYDAKGRLTAVTTVTITPTIGSITGMGAGCGTFLTTPTSANLRGCLTDESGTGLAYFQGGDIGTPSAGNGSNLTNLNAGNISSGNLSTSRLNGGTGASGTTFWRGDGVWAAIESTAPTTWTPSDASGAGLTFTSVNAVYAKYNRMIIVQFILTFPSTANGSTASIGNLPAASLSTGASFTSGACRSGAANFFVSSPLIAANGTSMSLLGTGSGTAATNANLSLAALSCVLTYITN